MVGCLFVQGPHPTGFWVGHERRYGTDLPRSPYPGGSPDLPGSPYFLGYPDFSGFPDFPRFNWVLAFHSLLISGHPLTPNSTTPLKNPQGGYLGLAGRQTYLGRISTKGIMGRRQTYHVESTEGTPGPPGSRHESESGCWSHPGSPLSLESPLPGGHCTKPQIPRCGCDSNSDPKS